MTAAQPNSPDHPHLHLPLPDTTHNPNSTVSSPNSNNLTNSTPNSPLPGESNASMGSQSKPRSTSVTAHHVHLQQKQKQVHSKPLRRWPLAVACGAAIMVSMMTYSVLQERIMTRPYKSFNAHAQSVLGKVGGMLNSTETPTDASAQSTVRVEKPAFFQNSLFLVLANRLFAAAVAGGAIILRRSKSDLTSKAALSEYAVVSLCNVIATSCQYEALKWLTFPTVTIGKCTKMLPVMLILNYRSGKRYRLDDYMILGVVLLGSAVMISSGSIAAQRASSSEVDTPIGFILLVIYLFFDALTSTYQEKLFTKYEMSVYNQMLFINVTSATLSILGLSFSGGLRQSLYFLISYPTILRDITMLSLSAVAGQFAISYTIQTFGALLYAGIMTTRQLLSVVVSDIIFKHGLTVMQWLGAMMVFAALFYKIYKKAVAASSA